MARLSALGLLAIMVVIVSSISQAAVAAAAAAAPACSVVNGKLWPCMSYIKSGAGEPNAACCGGVKDVSDLVKSNADLVGICNCIKADLPRIGKTIPSRIAALPKSCRVHVNFPPVDPNYDCSKIVD